MGAAAAAVVEAAASVEVESSLLLPHATTAIETRRPAPIAKAVLSWLIGVLLGMRGTLEEVYGSRPPGDVSAG
jgi:hypothetical protein